MVICFGESCFQRLLRLLAGQSKFDSDQETHTSPLPSRSRARNSDSVGAKLKVKTATASHGGNEGQTLTKGKPGGKEPRGNLTGHSPFLSFSAASRKSATKAE